MHTQPVISSPTSLPPGNVSVIRASLLDIPFLEYLMEQNFAEDSFMRHTPADKMIHDSEREDVSELLHANGNQGLLLLASVNRDAAGYLLAKKAGTERQPHVVSFHMWICKECRGNGVGGSLMRGLFDWCREDPAVQRIELDVMECNVGGVRLYQRFGFVEEGRRSKSAVRHGRYYDLIQMACWINNKPGE